MDSHELEAKAVPFFARFLSFQEETSEPSDEPTPIWTWKWPSDWEDS